MNSSITKFMNVTRNLNLYKYKVGEMDNCVFNSF